MALRVLIKLKRETINALHDPTTGTDWLYLDKNKPWFEKSYVAEAHARNHEINQALREGIIGYAVWADGEGVVKTFDNIEDADFAMRNAKMTLATTFEVPEPENQEPAPSARKGKTVAPELGAAAS